VLEGKQRPQYDRPEPTYRPEPTRYEPPPKQKDNVVTFEEAKSSAGIPSGVNWVFVTDRQRSSESYSGSESSAGDSAFVAYGRTDSKHVFAAVRHRYYETFYVGGGPKTDVWFVESTEYPIRGDEGKTPAWLYGNIVKALKTIGFEGRFNSKVQSAAGWELKEWPPRGMMVSLKHFLVNTGEVSAEDPSVAGRKHVIEMSYRTAFREEPGFHAIPKSYGGDEYVQVGLMVNGKQFMLDRDDILQLNKVRLGGNLFPYCVFGDYAHQGGKKNLTRSKNGKLLIQWMAEKLTSVAQNVRDTLAAAAAQMK